ncbi:MAG: hypothetical protein DHS20C15_06120 [Planctomycetota bacterium]|nr:MAG: hypothetical protein DHS20C15_06120 [Planctomycetota bacterium]
MRTFVSILLVLVSSTSLATPLVAQAQMPGDFPRLTISDAAGQAPAVGDPFDNSGVLTVTGGTSMALELSYLSEGPSNDSVPWAMLLSSQMSGLPLDQQPPPLYTMPPFKVIFPPGLFLGANGTASFFTVIPPSLTSGTAFLQAIVRDVDSLPNVKLSNGVAVTLSLPRYNAAFSFVRATAPFDDRVVEGVGSRDLGIDQLNTFAPLGGGEPPDSTTNEVFPEGIRFVPIVPTGIEGPVLPLARPSTLVSDPINAGNTVELLVEDTTGFPPEGQLLVQFGSDNPWGNKTSVETNSPNIEIVGYTGLTPTSFTGLTRAMHGSEGSSAYPHQAGNIVLGDFTMATTPGAFSRDRVGLDARNMDVPRVTIPAFTFEEPVEPEVEGGGAEGDTQLVTRELDLLRYRVEATGGEGFAVLDHRTHEFSLLEGTEMLTSEGLAWDPIITLAPDNRSFLAALHVSTGVTPTFASDPDRLFAIRLDGLDWPASGSPVWEITYQLANDPTVSSKFTRSRRLLPQSFAIVNTDPEKYVAYVGLGFKFATTSTGGETSMSDGFVIGYESAYAREDVLVRDLIEVALVPPGSTKSPPSMPRPWITDEFPKIGNALEIRRFDPIFAKSPKGDQLAIAAGNEAKREDLYVIAAVSVNQQGVVSRLLLNVTGFGLPTGSGEAKVEIRSPMPNGGAGSSRRLVFSPEGTQLALLDLQSARRDWLHTARTNGLDYGNVSGIYKDIVGTTPTFRESGPYQADHEILQLHWLDEDRIVYFMGETSLFDPLSLFSGIIPATDLFMYDRTTDLMTNLTRSGGGGEFDTMGTLQPIASWMSDDERLLYILRNGPIKAGNTVLPPGTPVTNLIALDRETLQLIDVSGDEFTDSANLPNLFFDDEQFVPVYETPSRMHFTRGRGAQANVMWFASTDAQDETATQQVFSFRETSPNQGFQATYSGADGSQVSDLTPSPFSGKLAYARTGDSDPFGATQHPFVVDLDNFLFERDLASSAEMMGMPFGRVQSGSFHFIAPTGQASEALAFVFGMEAGELGVASDTEAFFVPMRNISNPVLQPDPIVLPLLSADGLGAGSRLYLTSAGPSVDATSLPTSGN